MLQRLKQWQRRRIVRRHPVEPGLWRRVTATLTVLDGLSGAELRRLHDQVILFLHEKQFYGARGLTVTDAMQLAIAVQACLPILNLDLDYYRGWYSIICYRDAFVTRHQQMDSAGVVHAAERVLTGEAWERGPVILSVADAMPDAEPFGAGTNVVIHEMAHKLDMLTGQANGFPPLHPDMSTDQWAAVMSSAYRQLRRQVQGQLPQPFDPYGAENPAEFFAVMSECFFTAPALLSVHAPQVYAQLTAFYRQDPVQRQGGVHGAENPLPVR
ncbi:MAG: zinc-dependent peptidase [Gammaproteobacteria bacterium]